MTEARLEDYRRWNRGNVNFALSDERPACEEKEKNDDKENKK